MAEQQRHERRKFLKQAAVATWATPLILTMTPSRAGAQAGSCSPGGTVCGVWDDALGTCVPSFGEVNCCAGCAPDRDPPVTGFACLCTFSPI